LIDDARGSLSLLHPRARLSSHVGLSIVSAEDVHIGGASSTVD